MDEFRRNSDGASFHILKLSDFLDLFNVGQQVVQEVRQEEAKLAPIAFPSTVERLRRGQIAEAAVLRWLRDKMPDYVPYPSPPDGGLDQFFVGPSREIVGVIIKVIRDAPEYQRRLREVIELVRTLPDNAPTEIWICVVADDQLAAQTVQEALSRRKRDSGTWRISIGWLDELLSFVELSTFRFD